MDVVAFCLHVNEFMCKHKKAIENAQKLDLLYGIIELVPGPPPPPTKKNNVFCLEKVTSIRFL